MSDRSITATGAGIGVAAAVAFGVNSVRAGGVSPASTAGFALIGGALLGAGAAWAVGRENGPQSAINPFVALPTVAGAALVGGAVYHAVRSVDHIPGAALAAAGPALLAAAGFGLVGALVYAGMNGSST